MEHLNAVRDLLGNAWKVHLEGSTILTAAGAAAVTYLSYSLFKKVVWTPFKLYALAQVLPGVDLKKQGEWAVITGATDGLGKLELEPIMHCLTMHAKMLLRYFCLTPLFNGRDHRPSVNCESPVVECPSGRSLDHLGTEPLDTNHRRP